MNNSFMRLVGMDKQEILNKHVHVFTPSRKGRYQSVTGEYVEIDDRYLDRYERAQDPPDAGRKDSQLGKLLMCAATEE